MGTGFDVFIFGVFNERLSGWWMLSIDGLGDAAVTRPGRRLSGLLDWTVLDCENRIIRINVRIETVVHPPKTHFLGYLVELAQKLVLWLKANLIAANFTG